MARDPLGGPGEALFRQLNGKHIVTVMHYGLVHCDSRSGRLDCECPERALLNRITRQGKRLNARHKIESLSRTVGGRGPCCLECFTI